MGLVGDEMVLIAGGHQGSAADTGARHLQLQD